jgi:N-acetylated-alpha-linked acidic dipeptidase
MVQLKNASEEFQKIYSNGLQLPVEKQNELNMLLYKAERSLIDPDGLPRRPWYKHEIYAPGYYTGYGVKTLPGIREAIEQRNWKEAQDNIEIVSKVLQAYNTQVQDAIDLVKKNAEKKSF